MPDFTAPTANAGVSHTSDTSINNAIDHLTEALTAFCFKHLETSVSIRGTSNCVDKGIDLGILENELRVQEILAI